MKIYNKLISILLVCLMAFALISCAADNPGSAPEDKVGTAQVESTGEEGNAAVEDGGSVALPLCDTPTRFKAWCTDMFLATGAGPNGTSMIDMNEKRSVQLLEEKTNVGFDWIIASDSSSKEQFSLLIAGDEYPDVFLCREGMAYPGGYAKAIDDEIIVDLREMIEQSCPNYMTAIHATEATRKTAYTDEGNMAYFLQIKTYTEPVYMGYFTAQKWIDAAGFSTGAEIDTIAEWEQLLTVIRDSGEVSAGPLYLDSNTGMSNLAGAFGAEVGMQRNGDVVSYGPTTEAYKNYLATMADWYEKD